MPLFRPAVASALTLASLALAACTLAIPETQPAARPAPRAPVAPTRVGGCLDETARSVLALANRERTQRRLLALTADSRLQRAAQSHADDMARGDFMDHAGSDGSDPGERAEEVDYDWTAIAENVAAGQPTAETVMRSWMESPGHRDNLLAGDVQHVGVGYAYRGDTRLRHYWVMVFADTEERVVPPRGC
jgi:uncharacterized protein YkwD